MHRNRTRAGSAGILLALPLLLGGCTENVRESCSGANHENSCTASLKRSDGQWSTDLEGGSWDSTIVINGTFTIESGSGTLVLKGSDTSQSYELSADEPVVVTDLTLELIDGSGVDDDPSATLKMLADPTLEGFSAD